MALFESNVPSSFLEEERSMFGEFLDPLPGPYFVVEDSAGHPVGCGGLASRDGEEATLCWGMVDFQRHKEGVGRVLLRVRLAVAARMPGISRVGMNTSNETAPFFEREGLRTVKVTENYFRPGLHRHDMVCELDATRRAEIEARLSAMLALGHSLESGVLTVG
jgi:hypothetical protein